MPINTTGWDIIDHLNSDEMIEEYFAQVLEDGDGEEVKRALGHIARARYMAQLAQKCGMGYDSLRMALDEGSKPDIDTLLKVARSLGLRITTRRVIECNDNANAQEPNRMLPVGLTPGRTRARRDHHAVQA